MFENQRAATAAIALAAALLFGAAAAQDTAQEQAKIAAGETVYNTYCAPCHGDGLASTGQFFDLRRLTAGERGRFEHSVRNGKNQMPPWKDVLSAQEIDQLWHYIRAHAYQK
jgi:mono/diheme cytochrome c family protein